MKRENGLNEKEMELVKLLMADCHNTGDFCRRFPPFYLTACVWSLLSVATFGCIFSIIINFGKIAFTQFIFQTRFARKRGH